MVIRLHYHSVFRKVTLEQFITNYLGSQRSFASRIDHDKTIMYNVYILCKKPDQTKDSATLTMAWKQTPLCLSIGKNKMQMSNSNLLIETEP